MEKHDATWSGDKVYFSHEDGTPCWIKVKQHCGGLADVLATYEDGVWSVTHKGTALDVISVGESDPDQAVDEDIEQLADWEADYREGVASDKQTEAEK